MKRRIYKKWLKNPLNRRLIWKFCKPFPKVPPVCIVGKARGWGKTIEYNERVERMKQKKWIGQ